MIPATPAVEAEKVPRMTTAELLQFVMNYCDGKIFTAEDVKSNGLVSISSVFMLIGLGAFRDWDEKDIEKIGTVWEYLSEAGPRSFNGMPCFLSFRTLHKEDMMIASKAIDEELDRRGKVQVDGSVNR